MEKTVKQYTVPIRTTKDPDYIPEVILPFGLDSSQYSSIFNSLTEGILVCDRNGVIVYANHAAYDILNMPYYGITGRTFASLFIGDPENDAFTQTFMDAVRSDTKHAESVVPLIAGGKKKHLRVWVSSLSGIPAGESGYILVFTDLSELVELRDTAQDMSRISSLNHQLTIRNELLQKAFGMYLSDAIVQELIEKESGPVLGGIKKMMTVMMSDLRGFTALSEQMDANDLINMLNHYLGVMTEIIQKHGGTIIEFIGDGIMAIFGAPVEDPSHAEHAVCAAIEMQAAMPRVNQWNARRNYARLEMGIGVNTGEVIVGNVGSMKRMKYGVVGSNVNLCGRIESYTIGNQILISPKTRDQVNSPLTIAREIVVSPKGVEQDVKLTQVTGIGEPYNLSMKVRKEEPKKLPAPLPVSFFRIRGKHIGEDVHYGGITALGRGIAVMQTEAALRVYDNIQVKAGGNLLCKVLDDRDGSYELQFTSVPAGFPAWVRSCSEFT